MEKTLAKGLIVLEALVRHGAPCGVSDLAVALGISKSNTHRLLNTLVDTGYVSAADGRYFASLKTWELGTLVIAGYDVRDLARPAMTRLVRETAEGVRLTVLDLKALEVVYIDKIDSPQDVRTFTEIGGRAPAQCTSSGKILLAYQDETVIRRAARRLAARTSRTIVHPAKFIRHLERARADGYAVNQRELSSQVSGVAAPIFDQDNQIIAALSIAAPADRLPLNRLKTVAGLLCRAAASVTARMQPSGSAAFQLPTLVFGRGRHKAKPGRGTRARRSRSAAGKMLEIQRSLVRDDS
jgi:DNA-binding IclR family transcriptional regulator